MTHANYPDERSRPSALSPATLRAVRAEEERREAEYQRYLKLQATPEYQALVQAARERLKARKP